MKATRAGRRVFSSGIAGKHAEMILVVDDDVLVRALLREKLAPEVTCVSTPSEGLAFLAANDVTVLVVAIECSGGMPLELLETIHARAPDALRVLLTDRLDQRGAAAHRLADAVWPRTLLDADRLAAWLSDELGVEPEPRVTARLAIPLEVR